MQDPKNTIIQFLEIIGYQGNKESYATDFINVCHEQAMLNLSPELQHLYMASFSNALIDNFQELFEATYEHADEDKQKAMNSFLSRVANNS